jgi:porin
MQQQRMKCKPPLSKGSPVSASHARRVVLALGLVNAAAFSVAAPAFATPPQLTAPAPAPEASGAPGASGTGTTGSTGSPSCVLSCLKRSNQLLGNMFGLRPALSKHGITLTASETSELLGNISGGYRHGFAYDGLTQADLQLDTQRAFGHYGGLLNVSALQLHGRNLSAENLGSLQTASGIESDPATRFWEIWYQQQLGHENRVDLKLGQQSLDQEFMVDQNSLMFVNTMFGWPMLPSADMPGGGPAYPLSALGARLRVHPNNSMTILGGVFNGSPSRSNDGDAQLLNHSGTNFPLNGGMLAIGEVQYTYPGLGAMVSGDHKEPLSRTYKLGAWYDSENFDDLAIDENGLPLANPLSNGNPRGHQGNFSIYGTVDQMLKQDPNNPYKTLNFFARAMGTPRGDQNTIAFSVDTGLTLHDPLPHRRDDTLGLGLGYTNVTSGARAADATNAQFGGGFTPIRGSETFVEATYQMQLHPWLQIQPDIQYVMNPGGGIANPNIPNQRVRNETVIGVRTIIQL